MTSNSTIHSLNTRLNNNRQKGYATVLTLVLFVVIWLAVQGLYNAGQLTSHKLRQQTAADAVAYSVATQVSRELNFIAYTNRAMVANQVAIGQMVGLASWSKMIGRTTESIKTVARLLSWVPGVGAALNGFSNVLDIAADAMDKIIEPMVKAVIPIFDSLNLTYSLSQKAMHLGMNKAILKIYTETIKANDKDVDASLMSPSSVFSIAKYGKEVRDFLEQTNSAEISAVSEKQRWDSARYNEFASIVKNSRDQFSIQRSNNWWPLPGVFGLKIEIPKYGGSEFDRRMGTNRQYVWEWNAMDTVNIGVKVGWGWFSYSVGFPLGYGGACAVNNKRPGTNCKYWPISKSRFGNGAWKNRISAGLASSLWATNNLAKINGLRKFYDIKVIDRMISKGPGIVVLLQKSMSKINTWRKVLEPREQSSGIDTNIEKTNNTQRKMYALAKAEPYFSRPSDLSYFKRHDSHREYGNLYNPYWQTRLVETSTSELLQAQLIAGRE